MLWTEERVEEFKKLCADKLPYSAIGKHFGISRNACIGKAHRLRINNGRHTHAAAQEHVKRPRRNNLHNVTRFLAKANGHNPGFEPQPAYTNVIPPEQRKTLLQLTAETCRWPIGDPRTPDFHFCGKTEADNAKGQPYCRHHADMAYVKPTKKPFIPYSMREGGVAVSGSRLVSSADDVMNSIERSNAA